MSTREDESLKIVGAEVLRHSVRRACLPESAAELGLRDSEQSFKTVGRGRDARIVVALKELAAIAAGDTSDMVDEVPSGGAKASSRSLVLQFLELLPKALVRLVSSRRRVGTLRIRRDLVGNLAKNANVSLGTTSGAGSMPVRSKCVVEFIQDWVVAFFFFANCTAARTASNRLWRTSSGGLRGARPDALEACRAIAQSSAASCSSDNWAGCAAVSTTVPFGPEGTLFATAADADATGLLAILCSDSIELTPFV